MSGRAFSAIVETPWAMTEGHLQVMLEVAARKLDAEIEIEGIEGKPEPPEPDALAAETGTLLEGTRRVLVRDGVGIVPVVGPLFRRANLFTEVSGATSLETLARDFRAAVESPEVDSILLDVDSPGGEANGVSEMSDLVFEARGEKPIRAFVGGTGASGAFWIASAADEVVAADTSLLGSIGVRTAFTDTRERDREEGVRTIEIVSSQSPRKAPDPTEEEGRAQIQRVVDQIASVFIGDVARNRGVSRQTVLEDFGRGGVLVGENAVDRGLADRIGTFEEEIGRLTGPSPDQAGSFSEDIAASEGGSPMSDESSNSETSEVQAPETMTAEEITERYPDAASELRAQGAEEERERIQAIEEIDAPGHEDLVAEMKFDPEHTADSVSRAILEAEKQQREDQLAARRAEEEELEAPEPRAGADAAGEADEVQAEVRRVLTAGRV